jgi:branched-chain amino acid transport system permease protein
LAFLITQILNGLVYGTLLFLTAAGLSLIFGLMNVVSLAHGSFFMLGAYFALVVLQQTHSFALAMILAPIPAAILGMAMEYLFLRPLYRRGHLDQVLLTFGFIFVFFDLVKTVWGTTIRSLTPPEALQGVVEIADGPFPVYRLFLIFFGGALALALWFFLERSRLGAKVRAGVDDSAMASGLGINVRALFTAVFGAGVALAAIGGVAAGPVLGLYPGMDFDILIPAFIVIVVGGMGSLRGAFVGSLLIGEADTFGKAYLPGAALFLIYLVMAVILLVRPQGLFGVKKSEQAIVEPPITASHAAAVPRETWLAWLVVLAFLIIFPLMVSNYPRALVAELFIFAMFAMSLDILLGYTGLMSLGHATFFGLGAYAVVILGALFGVNAWIGVGAGIVLAAAGAAFFGFFCVRTSGVAFLMLTLAFSQLVFSVALKWRDVTGGSDGLAVAAKPGFLFWSLNDPLAMYYMALGFFVLTYWGLRRLTQSPLGHIFIGIRQNESRMRAIGYSTQFYKLLAFIIGGTVAGFAGGLYAIYNGFISPDALYWSASGDVLIMVSLGGSGTLIGPAIGTACFLLMKNLVSSYSDHWMFIIGAVFISCVMFFPAGIWGTLWQFRVNRLTAERAPPKVNRAI